MDNSYELALKHLQLIKNNSSGILQMAEKGKDLNKEVERIKGYMTAVNSSSEEVQKYLEENKTKLGQQPPPEFYKSKA